MQIEGRGRDVQQDLASRGDQVLYRIHAVQTAVPKVLIVPSILANRKCKWNIVEWNYGLLVRGSKVAYLVEHIVGWQEPFRLDGCDLPVPKQGRRVQNGFAGGRFRRRDQAADHRNALRAG